MKTREIMNYPIIVAVGQGIENFNKETGSYDIESFENKVFKYIVIHNPALGEEALQLLIFQESKPYCLHAAAVWVYMRENNITTLTINGGGKVSFLKKKDGPFEITFHGESGSFKKSSIEDFISIVEKLEEIYTVKDKTPEIIISDISNRKSFELDGISLNQDDVLKEIKKCSMLEYTVLTLTPLSDL